MVTGCQWPEFVYIECMTQISHTQWVEELSEGAGTRDRLVAAAGEHFSKFGYDKTTLNDLAKAIGFSKTYFYRFFKSKQEIGEAICGQVLAKIIIGIEEDIVRANSAPDKLRRMLRTVATMGTGLFFEDRKLYEIAAISTAEHWGSHKNYTERLTEIIQQILLEGRENGQIERKTPVDETVRAIMLAMQPFIDPRVLQYNLDHVPDGCNELVSLLLRSLAP
ncbi:TetR family transcriptional regulator [Novosphingobium sp. PhB165]|nr:TetR family transcriptional regulator [Novosphingobium sp. PhB165]